MLSKIFKCLILVILLGFIISCESEKKSDIIFTPSHYNFGSVNISDKATQDFVIKNKKKTEITLGAVTLASQEFYVDPSVLSGKTIAADGGELNFNLDFIPLAPAGTKSDTLKIEWLDANFNTGSIKLKLKGKAQAVPLIQLNFLKGDFGFIKENTSATLNFEVSNIGTSLLKIFAPTISGVDAAKFVITSGLTGGDLAPGNSITISIDYTPTAIEVNTAVLEITHDASNETTPFLVPLTGEGVDPAILVTPSVLDFGEIVFGSIDIQNFEIKNTGSGTLEIVDVIISNLHAGDFHVMEHMPIRISAGNTKNLPIMFLPTVNGSRGPASVTIINNSGIPANLEIRGISNPQTDLLNENFDGASLPLDWRIGGSVWNHGKPISGPSADYTTGNGNCVATNVAGDYQNSMTFTTNYLETPVLDLTKLIEPKLRFYAWYYTESCCDGCVLLISSNNGTSWSYLPSNNRPVPSFDGIVTSSNGQLVWRGSKTNWHEVTLDLSQWQTFTQFKIRWAFSSDSSISWYPGYYLDDVVVEDAARLPNKANIDYPSDLANSIPISGFDLSWFGNATEYDVYLDIFNPPLNIHSKDLSTNSIDVGTLEPHTTYFWRVNSKTSKGTVLGDVWSFTTN